MGGSPRARCPVYIYYLNDIFYPFSRPDIWHFGPCLPCGQGAVFSYVQIGNRFRFFRTPTMSRKDPCEYGFCPTGVWTLAVYPQGFTVNYVTLL